MGMSEGIDVGVDVGTGVGMGVGAGVGSMVGVGEGSGVGAGEGDGVGGALGAGLGAGPRSMTHSAGGELSDWLVAAKRSDGDPQVTAAARTAAVSGGCSSSTPEVPIRESFFVFMFCECQSKSSSPLASTETATLLVEVSAELSSDNNAAQTASALPKAADAAVRPCRSQRAVSVAVTSTPA